MTTVDAPASRNRLLFVGCFLALIATAFGFIVRAMLIDTWGEQFNLSETQKGEILGVGLWPFAISIVLFSLVIDRIGYGRAMVFAFACHVTSAVVTIFAKGYWGLWIGTFIVALGNGTVEAVINPVVTTMFRHDKTKWLNMLHAGWPGGLVLGGLLAVSMGEADWRLKVALLLIPTVLYALLLLPCRFPVQERVAAGVSYRDMLRETGGLGMLVVLLLVFLELGRVCGVPSKYSVAAAGIAALAFTFAVFSLGRLMFVFLLLLMIPLATTELGVDSWSTSLMTGEMHQLGLNPVYVLLYTSFIMMVLRLFAGPIVHRLSPLGLLATCSGIAAVGLFALSHVTGSLIFVAATLYGVGKSFFWPTMLGVVAERFPKGGALTLNATGGVGMLGVGVVGAVFLGYFQDTKTVEQLRKEQPAIEMQVVRPKEWIFGQYDAVQPEALPKLTPEQQASVKSIQAQAQKSALQEAALFPVLMLVCYGGLLLLFRARGGYRAEQLDAQAQPTVQATGSPTGQPTAPTAGPPTGQPKVPPQPSPKTPPQTPPTGPPKGPAS
jgi:MFS family permease